MTRPGRAAVVGGGLIGGGWAARFLLHGWDVAVFDPAPDARRHVDQVLAHARRSLPSLTDAPMPAEGRLSFVDTLAEAVRAADWIQESVPERLAIKQRVLSEVLAQAPRTAVIASSTSGFRPSELQQGLDDPGRVLVAHPFNPVYLLPLVEVVAGEHTDPDTVQAAQETLRAIGMSPLLVRSEIDAHIADRLMESVWREALWLINDGIATTAEIDDAIRFGFGLRWAQMGLFETYRIAGGEGGMAHFINQFGPSLQWPWSKLTEVPELTDELVANIAAQSDAQSGAYSIRELERIRDDNLVAMMCALKERNWGVGELLRDHDRRLAGMPGGLTETELEALPRLLEVEVVPAWVDARGRVDYRHMTSFLSDSCEMLLNQVESNSGGIAQRHRLRVIESHVRHQQEPEVGQRLYSTARVHAVDGDQVRVFLTIHVQADGQPLATAEQWLQLDSENGPADPEVLSRLRRLAQVHARHPLPERVGRLHGIVTRS